MRLPIIDARSIQHLYNKIFRSPKIDIIAEETSGAGVTVDSVLLKDGNVNAVSTDGGASPGPLLVTHRDSASPTAGDFIGRVDFNGEDSASNQESYARIIGQIDDPTSTSEDGTLLLQTVVAGTLTTQLDISSGGFVITPDVTISGNVNAVSTDAGSGAGPDLIAYRNSASPGAADLLGRLLFKGRNDASGDVVFASVEAQLDDESNGAEDGSLLLKTIVNNASTTQADISSAGFVITPPVTITAGSITGITDLAIADGGTGSSTAADARTALGVAIGSDVQAFGAVLDDFNTLGAAASDGEVIVATGAGAFAYESGATLRTSIGVAIGSDVQAHSAVLDATTASFTTADETKLDGIEAAATADQTGADIVSALSGEDLEANSMTIRGAKLQCFEATFQNVGGAIKHYIGQPGSGASGGDWIEKIIAASSTAQTTPTGTDASTAFAYGAKISSASANIIIFDVAAQTDGQELHVADWGAFDTNGTAICFRPGFASRDVNGTTIYRLEVQVKDLNGAAFNVNTTNLPNSNDRVAMTFMGYLK